MMKKRNRYLFPSVIVFLLIQGTSAQHSLDSLNADELFFRARNLAFNGQRDSARVILKKALVKSPEYADIRILLARTYAWDGRRSEAREELLKVLSVEPDYKDALSAAIDVEIWDEHYSDALTVCNRALKFHSNDEEFLVKRVKIYRALDRDEEALYTIKVLEEINRSNKEIQPLRESITSKSLMNSINAMYTYDRFSLRFDPQQLFSLEYDRTTPIGTVFGRINIADRFANTAVQYEVDAYPLITDGFYGFLNYGYSANSVFPEHRLGIEGFFKLPESFEGSLGLRYLYFGPGNDATIYTGAVGYYYGNYWFSLRPYFTPGTFSISRSYSMTVRRYFGGEGDYASLKIGAGASPDNDRFVDTLNVKLYNLKAQTIGIGYQYIVNIYSTVIATFDFTNQELGGLAGTYAKVYSFSIGYKYKF